MDVAADSVNDPPLTGTTSREQYGSSEGMESGVWKQPEPEPFVGATDARTCHPQSCATTRAARSQKFIVALADGCSFRARNARIPRRPKRRPAANFTAGI